MQYNRLLFSAFGIEEATGGSIKVSFVGWSTTSPDPNPAFATYGSLVDVASNDPTTVLPSFGEPYDVECMWAPDGRRRARKVASAQPARRACGRARRARRGRN